MTEHTTESLQARYRKARELGLRGEQHCTTIDAFHLLREQADRITFLEKFSAEQVDALTHLAPKFKEAQEAATRFNDIIDRVEGRCLAADGPVTPTLQEMTEQELRQLWLNVQSIRRALDEQ